MKRSWPLLIAVLVSLSAIAYGVTRTHENPDPNHMHADFAVWVNGQMLDFSDQRYMSEAYDPESGQQLRVDPLRKFLHLHDGNGHVIHRHKPGLTLGDFVASIGLPMTSACLTLDDFQYGKLDAGWKSDFAIDQRLCNNGKFHWTMIVNGEARVVDGSYVLNDSGKILLSYSASDTAAMEEWDSMTDDACRYSQTCPWRGSPPTENCIADPEVPCTEPE